MSKIINVSHLFDDEGPRQPDVVTFDVSWLDGDKVQTREFETFASAAGFAGALHDRIRRLVILSGNINNSHFGSMYYYRNNSREKVNPGFIAEVKAALANR